MQDGHAFLVEVRHRAWREGHGFDGPLTRGDAEAVINEVELHGAGPTAIRNRGRGEATGGHIERDMPLVVQLWTQDEPNLPDNLRPHMQGGIGIVPGCQRQARPECRAVGGALSIRM